MNNDQTPIDDDMNFVMRRLSFKDDSVTVNRSLQVSGTINPLPNLSLVLYQDPGNFFSKLCKNLKFWQVGTQKEVPVEKIVMGLIFSQVVLVILNQVPKYLY